MKRLAVSLRPDNLLGQAGQALVESLVAMLGLIVLWVAVHWLAHYQDAALSATHASRHQAFLASRGQDEPDLPAVMAGFFSGSAHRWTDRRGAALLPDLSALNLDLARQASLSEWAQPGANHGHTSSLRREWSLQDDGILKAEVGVAMGSDHSSLLPSDSQLGLHVFDLPYPVLARSISILKDAGHSASDQATQSRVGQSALAWSAAQTRSAAVATEVTLRAAGVDAAWGRPAPSLDWLQPWSGEVPTHVLTEYTSAWGK